MFGAILLGGVAILTRAGIASRCLAGTIHAAVVVRAALVDALRLAEITGGVFGAITVHFLTRLPTLALVPSRDRCAGFAAVGLLVAVVGADLARRGFALPIAITGVLYSGCQIAGDIGLDVTDVDVIGIHDVDDRAAYRSGARWLPDVTWDEKIGAVFTRDPPAAVIDVLQTSEVLIHSISTAHDAFTIGELVIGATDLAHEGVLPRGSLFVVPRPAGVSRCTNLTQSAAAGHGSVRSGIEVAVLGLFLRAEDTHDLISAAEFLDEPIHLLGCINFPGVERTFEVRGCWIPSDSFERISPLGADPDRTFATAWLGE